MKCVINKKYRLTIIGAAKVKRENIKKIYIKNMKWMDGERRQQTNYFTHT